MNIIGSFELYDIEPDGQWLFRSRGKNTLMVSAGFAVAQLLGYADARYKVSHAYLEYENNAPPITAPSFTEFDARSYYDSLTTPQDYIRAPVSGPPLLSIATGYEDYFTEGVDGNQLTFIAETVGATGENGLTFSSGANSTVYGIALVAAPVSSVAASDVLIARAYLGSSAQVTKSAGRQIGVKYALKIPPS